MMAVNAYVQHFSETLLPPFRITEAQALANFHRDLRECKARKIHHDKVAI